MYKIPNTDLIAMDESEYLEHFGIPGMKWGHRKASGSKVQNGVSKDQVKSAKSIMKNASRKYVKASRFGVVSNKSKEALSSYRKASGDYYNTKRQFKGKSTRSNASAAGIQMHKNSGARFLKRTAIATLLYTSIAAAAATPYEKRMLKASAQYTAAQGVKSVATILGTAAGKATRVARKTSESGAINKVVNAARRAKKYGKYINTTGFSVPSPSRLIGN